MYRGVADAGAAHLFIHGNKFTHVACRAPEADRFCPARLAHTAAKAGLRPEQIELPRHVQGVAGLKQQSVNAIFHQARHSAQATTGMAWLIASAPTMPNVSNHVLGRTNMRQPR